MTWEFNMDEYTKSRDDIILAIDLLMDLGLNCFQTFHHIS